MVIIGEMGVREFKSTYTHRFSIHREFIVHKGKYTVLGGGVGGVGCG